MVSVGEVSLGALLAGATRDGGTLSATIPAQWLQGRTTYGGLSTMLALEAAKGLADDLPPLRSATVTFLRPLGGAVTARATLVRRGRSASFVDAEVSGEEGVGLKAGFVFVADRESDLHHDDNPMPAVVDPDTAADAFRSGGPGFAPNFEWRHASAEQRRGVPELLLWVRLREREGLAPATELIAMADVLPPGAMPLMTERRPISSITWLVNLLSPLPVTTDGWWLLRSTAHHLAGGFSSQHMTMWNRAGVCVAQGMQSVAIF
ncbi:acyl-CoA thioesterase [Sphingomonas abietis]|uniref:Thioesterase family protein n=1 Tax=Sphingomonas abietis TaxID=3012344 RepID=A0ABY7NQD1_9SPHN|nr:thioesterase family protein [Sphingomonas abietis]WBO21696.1 thioesterase family protein [Sphingomonas abietis]